MWRTSEALLGMAPDEFAEVLVSADLGSGLVPLPDQGGGALPPEVWPPMGIPPSAPISSQGCTLFCRKTFPASHSATRCCISRFLFQEVMLFCAIHPLPVTVNSVALR